jgi:molybdopterin-guanine dinucleotide biosynthesis protein B
MKLIHIVGRKNHGKTTLIVELVRELTQQGIAVGTIKHSGHAHELDTPGKDSYRHRQAGASPAAIVTEQLIGLYLPRRAEADPYALLAPLFSHCGIVLVEGDLDGRGAKVEVWRKSAGGECLASARRDIRCVVTDDPLDPHVPVLPRSDVRALSRHLLTLV